MIDYVIASQSLFSNVLSFNIGEFKPWISDHCPTHFTLDIGHTSKGVTEPEKGNVNPLPSAWYWDENSDKIFESHLKNYETSHKLNDILSSSDGNKMANDINVLLTTTAEKCGIKKRKKNNKRARSNIAPWYDKTCEITKNKVIHMAKLVKKSPLNLAYRENLYILKKEYKNTIKAKKRTFQTNILDQMNSSRRDSRSFWKFLTKLKEKPNDNTFKKAIPDRKWKNHFKTLFTTKNKNDIPANTSETGCLDYDITAEELEEASYILRPNKSSGIDGVSNEMIICLLKTKPAVILKLFNTILSSGSPITTWNTSIISPIHKKGSKNDPDNYRAIALSCCMSKFFAAVLNKRLLKFATENKLIRENQLGFMPGNRTSDALIILYNLVNKYCKKGNKYIYSCFVDFKKAFDTVPRPILFQKLLSLNINGKFYNSIKNMYTLDLACIRLDDHMTETFNINQGVKQGCILSPLLFNIFISDLPENLSIGNSTPVHIDTRKTLNSLVWADDLLLLSETEKGLNNMLKNLENYTTTNLIKVNLTKTKCMIFNKTGRLIRRNFSFGANQIEMIREYRYLGFLITPSFNLHTALSDLKDRGLRAYGALKSKLGILFRKHILTSIHLFDSLVKPILLYASDFWGCLKLPKLNPIETLHVKFCKDLIGVQLQTTNLGALLELGRLPLHIYAKKNSVLNWERIGLKRQANNILLNSYDNPFENSWTCAVKSCVSTIGLPDLFKKEVRHSKAPNIQLFLKEKDIFQQTAISNIQNMSKLRTYVLIKQNATFEQYLVSVQNISDRIALTKFRLSNHRLMIEIGRHQGIKSPERVCPFCPDKVEDEFHFLLKCPTYNNLRQNLIDEINPIIIGFYYPKDEQFLFWFLLNNPMISHLVARYIRLSMELRAFLLDGPKK